VLLYKDVCAFIVWFVLFLYLVLLCVYSVLCFGLVCCGLVDFGDFGVLLWVPMVDGGIAWVCCFRCYAACVVCCGV